MRVFVLGAGFSKEAGYPLANELINCAGQVYGPPYNEREHQRWTSFTKWLDNGKVLSGPMGIIFSCGNPEYLLTYLDITVMADRNRENELFVPAWAAEKECCDDAYALIGDWKAHVERLRDEEHSHRETLIEAIWKYFSKKTKEDFGSVAPADGNCYQRFFNECVSEDDVLVSFNYDTVPERYLLRTGLWSPRDGYGFIHPLTDPHTSSGEYPRYSSVKLLKLHGSYGWLEDNGSIRFDRVFLEHLGISARKLWPSPFSEKYMMMPSFVKTLNNQTATSIWTKAAQALRKADDVVIIGYRAPLADSAARMLFGSSLSNRKCLVTIVSPDSTHEIMLSYGSILGKKLIHMRMKFGEWIEKGCPTG